MSTLLGIFTLVISLLGPIILIVLKIDGCITIKLWQILLVPVLAIAFLYLFYQLTMMFEGMYGILTGKIKINKH